MSYGVQPSPVDGSIWGQSMDIGFSRIDQPGYLIRFIPGPDPANTGLTEIFQPPPGSFSPRGIDVDRGFAVPSHLAPLESVLERFVADRRWCRGTVHDDAFLELEAAE